MVVAQNSENELALDLSQIHDTIPSPIPAMDIPKQNILFSGHPSQDLLQHPISSLNKGFGLITLMFSASFFAVSTGPISGQFGTVPHWNSPTVPYKTTPVVYSKDKRSPSSPTSQPLVTTIFLSCFCEFDFLKFTYK
jgi:hypothetical protein